MFGLLVVDDDPDSRLLVSHALRSAEAFDVVGETGRADEAVTLAQSLRPDVAVMDVILAGGTDSLSALPLVREVAPQVKVVLRSAFPPDDLRFAAKAGPVVNRAEYVAGLLGRARRRKSHCSKEGRERSSLPGSLHQGERRIHD